MRKTQKIHVAGRRQRSNIKDFIRQSPSQTLSSTSVTATGGGGGSTDPCTTAVPEPRNLCGEWTYAFNAVSGPSGWGGDWGMQTLWPQADIEGELAGTPFDNDSREWLNVASSWPWSPDGAYVFGSGGYLENGYAAEIWNESPLGSGNAVSLNSTVWYGGSVYNRNLHNYLDDTNEYFPVGIRFDFTVHEILDVVPSVPSAFRVAAVDVGLERMKWPIVYDPPFGDHSEVEAEHYHTVPVSSTSVSMVLKTPHFTPPSSGPKMFSVNRVSFNDGIEYDWQAGQRYSVLVCIDSSYTRAKVWEFGAEEPTDWQVAAGPIALPDGFTPGISATLPNLDFQPGDTESGSKVSFHFVRINPTTNPCVSGNPANPIYPCDDVAGVDDSPGYYMDTLIPKQSYWIPASSNVSYYKQIYFDGIAVFENEQYWLDGLKVYPKDPAIFSTTNATAEVVIR